MSDWDEHSSADSVPLFPLPNVVLFPRAVLPLHIFEERYKVMTNDVLHTPGRSVAMALLRPGWEKSYYGAPAIEPIVCIGSIVSHERLADGKYNFLLQGQVRGRVIDEVAGDLPYRVARIEPLHEVKVMEIDLSASRRRLEAMFNLGGSNLSVGIGRQFHKMLASAIPTADIADLLAFNLIEDVELKQSLLAETDVRRRVETIVGALEVMRPPASALHMADPSLN